MLVIGLTGGIGSGKTTVANMFADLEVPVIDTDKISRQLTERNNTGYKTVVDHFGKDILDQNKSIDRAKLRSLVFNDNNKLKLLESLLHPLIREEAKKRIMENSTEAYTILVVPLLFETDYHELIDRSLVVDVPEDIQLSRVMHRDGVTEPEARKILNAQLSRQQRIELADDVVVNDCSLDKLADKVGQLHQQYLQRSGESS